MDLGLRSFGRGWPEPDIEATEIPQCSGVCARVCVLWVGVASAPSEDSERFRSTPRTRGRFRGINNDVDAVVAVIFDKSERENRSVR
jgi:hypothetical protein